MYDGWDDVLDEVKQNAKDQQRPRFFGLENRTQELPPTRLIPVSLNDASSELKPIPGLNKRQMELINNKDDPGPNAGAARERRLDVIQRDISAIKRFLPRMYDVQTYLTTMPHDDDEELIEALVMADRQLAKFINDVTAKLRSLEFEFELKRVDA